MIVKARHICVLSAALAICIVTAEASEPEATESDAVCGLELHSRDVLVLDVQHLLNTPDLADDFVIEHAGEYRLADPLIEEVRMSSRPSKDPDLLIRAARKLGVQKGCDLVLVLKTGPYFGRQRSQKRKAKNKGYALVATGQRVAATP